MTSIVMEKAEAQSLTNQINSLLNSVAETIDKVHELVRDAQEREAWKALGYPSWSAYCAEEFSGAAAGLEKALRGDLVARLAGEGMSVRAIAKITDSSVGTVHRDVAKAGVPLLNTSSSEPSTTGVDGKVYRRLRPVPAPPAKERPKPRRRPLPDAYRDAVWDLEKVIERLVRLSEDDRFPANHEALYDRHQGDVGRLAQRLHDAVSMPLVRGGEGR